MIVRIREHPLSGALEYDERGNVGSDRRSNLKAARAGSDHDHAFTGVVDGVIPPCGMERRSGKRFDTRDIGNLRTIQLTYCSNDSAGFKDFLETIARAHHNMPEAGSVIPTSADDLGRESNLRPEIVAVRDFLEIGTNLRLLREVFGPMIGRFE